MRTLSKYFTGENDEKQLFDGTTTSYFIKPQQVFVTSFVGHKASATNLIEFEIIDVDPGAYADGQGNLVLPPQSGIEYVSAIGVDLGSITAEYEIHDDSGFTSLVTSGPLHPTNQTSVPVGLVGPFYLRYRLASSSTGIFSTWFTDTGSPFMNPEPLIGAGASVATVLNTDGTDPTFDQTFSPNVIFTGTFAFYASTSMPPPYTFQFELDRNFVVTRYKIWPRGSTTFPDAPIDYTFQGSLDGVTWSILDTRVNTGPSSFFNVASSTVVDDSFPHVDNTVASPGLFNRFRLVTTKTSSPSRDNEAIRIGEMQLIGYDPFSLAVPIIGAGVSVATVLSITADPPNGTPLFSPEQCINGNFTYFQAGGSPPFFVTLQLDQAYFVTRYKIWPRGSVDYPDAPTDYTFEGSNDGVSWGILDTQNNNPPPSYTVANSVTVDDSYGHLDIAVANPGAFNFYRLHVTRTTGPIRNNQFLNIGELQLLGFAV